MKKILYLLVATFSVFLGIENVSADEESPRCMLDESIRDQWNFVSNKQVDITDFDDMYVTDKTARICCIVYEGIVKKYYCSSYSKKETTDSENKKMGYCSYEYQGVKIVAEQLSDKKVKVNMDDSNAITSKDNNSGGKDSYTYVNKLDGSKFFNSEGFYCPQFNVLIHKNSFPNGNSAIKVTFSFDKPNCEGGFLGFGKNCDTHDKMDQVDEKGEYENICTYSVNKGNSIPVLTVENKGNGKVEIYNDGGKYNSKVKGIDTNIFFQNGKFSCENVKIIAEFCNNNDKMYWKLESDSEMYCSSNNGTNTETDVNDINKDDVTSGSEQSFTMGKTTKFLKKVYSIVKIVIPVLIVVLSIVDFLKVVLLSDEKDYKEAWNRFIKRIVIGIIFFVLPAIISLLINISGIETDQSFFSIFV